MMSSTTKTARTSCNDRLADLNHRRATTVKRREWLRRALAVFTAGVHFGGPIRVSRAVSERLRIGAIGVGNRGNDNLAEVPVDETVALCDVDARYLERAKQLRPHARGYRDFREMLDREQLDAVIISGPDHMHAAAALRALEKNIHVYCERPLARTIGEIARLQQEAKRRSVVTQMGNQHHSATGYQMAAAVLRQRLLGTIESIHAWTARPNWPQGVQRPAEHPPVPQYLEWNLWLGPAPWRPYHPAYHPMRWRGWWDFGTGTLGDMAIHLLDPVLLGLNLPEPRRIKAEVSAYHAESFPASSSVTFQVPQSDRPDLTLVWYDGGRQPPMEITGVRRLPPQGVLVISERGKMYIPELGGTPRFMPASLQQEMASAVLPRSFSSHMQNFLDACRGFDTTRSDFGYGGRLSRFALLGNIALLVPGMLEWSEEQQQFVNSREANQRLDEPWRHGW